MTRYRYGEGTDVGRERDHNEDTFISRPDLGLWIVADGMGGHAAGEVASAMAIQIISEQVALGIALAEAISIAHTRIQQEAQENPERRGMGCTVVALLVRDHHYQIAWVGDSRGYLWDGRHLVPLTRDHSFVQQLIDGGHLNEQDARVHPQRNVITQALGTSDIGTIQVDQVSGSFHHSEKILLCSDGLNGEITDGNISEILSTRTNEQEAVDTLIDAANQQGGSDNITVIIVSAPADFPKRSHKGDTLPLDTNQLNRMLQAGKRRTISPLVVVLALAVVVLVIASVAGYFWLGPGKDSQPAELTSPQQPIRQFIPIAPSSDPAITPPEENITTPEPPEMEDSIKNYDEMLPDTDPQNQLEPTPSALPPSASDSEIPGELTMDSAAEVDRQSPLDEPSSLPSEVISPMASDSTTGATPYENDTQQNQDEQTDEAKKLTAE